MRELEQLHETRAAEEKDKANGMWSSVANHKKRLVQLEASLSRMAQDALDTVEHHALLHVGHGDDDYDVIATRLRLEALRSHSLIALSELAPTSKRKQHGWGSTDGGLHLHFELFFVYSLCR